MTAHGIGDTALSTATLASFAIPEIGAIVAAAVGGAQALFDIFCPEQIDPSRLPVTQGDMSTWATAFAAKVDQAMWEKDISTMTAGIESENQLFLLFWNKMAHVKLTTLVVDPSAPGADDGGEFFDDNADSSLVTGTTDYFGQNTTNTYLAMNTAFKILANPGDTTSAKLDNLRRRVKNIPLYGLIGSTWISYSKAWVIWDWGHNHIIRRQEYDHWKLLSDRGATKTTWDATQVPTVPVWNDYRNNGLPVTFMLSVVDEILLEAEGDGTAANPGFFTTLVKNYLTDRPKLIADRLSKLSIQTGLQLGNTAYWYLDADATHGGTSPKTYTRALAELHLEAKRGALIAYWWEYAAQAYGLDCVTEDGITSFGELIKLWKAARASISFWTYTVRKNDTLDSIAASFAPDSLLANPVLLYDSLLYNKAIFDANRGEPSSTALSPGPWSDAPWHGVALRPGQVLMLPDKEVVDFTLYTVTATDKYPYTICDKFFGDRLLRGPLDAANTDISNPAAVGAIIRIPTVDWAWYPPPLYPPTLEGWATDQIDLKTKLPYYPHTDANGKVTTSTNWVSGFKVRYSVSFYTEASDTIQEAMETHRGPWTDWLHSANYFHPIFEKIPCDAAKQATSRRFYRQFHDEDAPMEFAGEIAGNDPKAPLYWHDATA